MSKLIFFILPSHTTTKTASKKLYQLITPTLQDGGKLIMYFPKNLEGKRGFEFLSINLESLTLNILSSLNETLRRRVLIPKDNFTFHRLLSTLHTPTYGITILESFVEYVISSKQMTKNASGWKNREEKKLKLMKDLMALSSYPEDTTIILLWCEYPRGKWKNTKTYLWDFIKTLENTDFIRCSTHYFVKK